MLSRIFWFGLAAVALIGGMILQDGGGILSWGDDTHISRSVDQEIEARIERAIDNSFDKMEVIDSSGREIEVSPETRRALANAVGSLVKAKTDLAMLRVRDASDEEIKAAEARSAAARAEVDRLKVEIRAQEQAATNDASAVREKIQQEVRDEVRTAVREAARN
jgi:hypothetical protein